MLCALRCQERVEWDSLHVAQQAGSACLTLQSGPILCNDIWWCAVAAIHPVTCSDFFTKLLTTLIFLFLSSAQCQGETAGTKRRLDHAVFIQLGADETLQCQTNHCHEHQPCNLHVCRDTIRETVHEVRGEACEAHLRTVGHLAVKREVVPWEGPLGVGVASSLTLPLLDTLLPVRRSSTLRGTLSRTPMLLHATHLMFDNICLQALLTLSLFCKTCS